MIFKEDIKHTYFNIPRDIYTRLDRTVRPENDHHNVRECDIIPLDRYDMIDHQPNIMSMDVSVRVLLPLVKKFLVGIFTKVKLTLRIGTRVLIKFVIRIDFQCS